MEAESGVGDLLREVNPIETKVPVGTSITGIFEKLDLITLAFFILGLIFMASLISAAIAYINSAGSPEAIGKATTRITNALLGLAIIFGAFIIVRLVLATLGLGSLAPFQ